MQAVIQQADPLTADAIADRIDEAASKKKERTSLKLDEIKEDVSNAIEGRDYHDLNGKWILREIAGEIGEDGSSLTRRVAEELHQMNQQPSELKEILSKIGCNCSRDPTFLYE